MAGHEEMAELVDNDRLDAFLRLCDEVEGEGEAPRHTPAGAPAAFHDADSDAGDPALRDRHAFRPFFEALHDFQKQDTLHAFLEYSLAITPFRPEDQLQLSALRDASIVVRAEEYPQGIGSPKEGCASCLP